MPAIHGSCVEHTFLHDGRWRMHTFCAECDTEFHYHDKSEPCCPYCGYAVDGKVATWEQSMVWVPTERKWWELHKIGQGKFLGMDDYERPVHEEG